MFSSKIKDTTGFDVHWDDHVANKARKPIHEDLLYALILHCRSKKWIGDIMVAGCTFIKKEDSTTRNVCIYRSDASFHGRAVKHWALFSFNDNKRPAETLNAGMIHGFV